MLHSKIKLSQLLTVSDCIEAIDRIEDNVKNYDCTVKQWVSGSQCNLKASAVVKIKAIENKLNNFPEEV